MTVIDLFVVFEEYSSAAFSTSPSVSVPLELPQMAVDWGGFGKSNGDSSSSCEIPILASVPIPMFTFFL